jgi:hypothetical protein
MKNIVLLFLACVLIISCGDRNVRTDYISSTDLYIGWLDLKAYDFKKYGYANQADWEKDIAGANSALKIAVAKNLKVYKVTGAAKMWEMQPAKGYAVQFSNIVLDPQAALTAEVAIKDATTGRTINKFSSKSGAAIKSSAKEPFAAKLNKACQAVANEIYMQMTQ